MSITATIDGITWTFESQADALAFHAAARSIAVPADSAPAKKARTPKAPVAPEALCEALSSDLATGFRPCKGAAVKLVAGRKLCMAHGRKDATPRFSATEAEKAAEIVRLTERAAAREAASTPEAKAARKDAKADTKATNKALAAALRAHGHKDITPVWAAAKAAVAAGMTVEQAAAQA